MSQATQSITLAWKEFNINLEAVDAWMKTNIGDHYCGNSAGNELNLWFTAEVTEDEKAAIELYWEDISTASAEATSYKSMEQVKAASQAKVTSGRNKLLALGLTEEEVSALLG